MNKDITGYEGLYKIDTSGNVYSTPSDGKPNKILKQEVIKRNHTNYRRVTLSKNGKVKRFQVHRLVMATFNFVDDMENLHVNHIDNNGENNSLENLEWVTHKENMKHSSSQGRQDKSRLLGGKVAGRLSKEKAEKKYYSMVGNRFGNRVLKSVLSLGKHPKGIFTCLICDKDFNATISTVIADHKKGKFLACRSCSLKNNNIKI